ncbi:hypothetical protein [Roseovarius spongiae]|uniref:hypothetical protein n=1 Tax=Roseovarius spongiae TaxID=2320272 RepID=UPI0014088EE3|nr:hypothetical protein [Roseovarius spongiae]
MYSRAMTMPEPRHARLFELIRQSRRAERTGARRPPPALDAGDAQAFMQDALRSLRP